MRHMYRLNHDGTVERCDDTPDVTYLGPKYSLSNMRTGVWICVDMNYANGMRHYVPEHEVPNVIKLADMIGG